MSKIFIKKSHPVHDVLAGHEIALGDSFEAQSSHPLKIGFVNLMPNPLDPVRDFSLLFARHGQHDVQILDFTPTPDLITQDPVRLAYRQDHLLHSSNIADAWPDAIILTGFGKEDVPFEELRFWPEITTALDYAKENNIPVLASCWGSHAALYHYHGVEKTWNMSDKISGVFEQVVADPTHPLMQDIDPNFTIPVSRYGRSDDSAMEADNGLIVLAQSTETGIAVAADEHVLYLTGHPEYPAEALANEYNRDKQSNVPFLRVPENVFKNDNPDDGILPISWAKNSGKLLRNWLESVHQHKLSRTTGANENFIVVTPSSKQMVYAK